MTFSITATFKLERCLFIFSFFILPQLELNAINSLITFFFSKKKMHLATFSSGTEPASMCIVWRIYVSKIGEKKFLLEGRGCSFDFEEIQVKNKLHVTYIFRTAEGFQPNFETLMKSLIKTF